MEGLMEGVFSLLKSFLHNYLTQTDSNFLFLWHNKLCLSRQIYAVPDLCYGHAPSLVWMQLPG